MNEGIVRYDALSVVFQEHPDEGRKDRLVASADQFRKRLAEVTRGEFEAVVRDLGKHMVHLVGTDAVDDVVDDTVVAIDGGKLALDEVPVGVGKPGYVELVVVEECDDDAIAGKDEVRYHVVVEECDETIRRIKLVEQVGHGSQACQGADAAENVPHEHSIEGVEMADRSGQGLF